MKLTKLTKDIGTKIENIDITKPLSNADILTIRQILAERGVVVLNVPNGNGTRANCIYVTIW